MGPQKLENQRLDKSPKNPQKRTQELLMKILPDHLGNDFSLSKSTSPESYILLIFQVTVFPFVNSIP